MFDVGGGELLLILFAVLLLFGPKKIPEIAQMVGKGMQHVKKAQEQIQSQINDLQNEIKTQVEQPVNSVSVNPPAREIESYIPPSKTSEEIESDYARNNGIINPETIVNLAPETGDSAEIENQQTESGNTDEPPKQL